MTPRHNKKKIEKWVDNYVEHHRAELFIMGFTKESFRFLYSPLATKEPSLGRGVIDILYEFYLSSDYCFVDQHLMKMLQHLIELRAAGELKI